MTKMIPKIHPKPKGLGVLLGGECKEHKQLGRNFGTNKDKWWVMRWGKDVKDMERKEAKD